MRSAELLNAADFCERSGVLGLTWQRNNISPMAALYQAIEAGLQDESEDPGQAAGDHFMGLAVDRGLDTPQSDLYGQANHLASLADYITWLLRAGDPWKRPEPIDGWEPSSFLHGNRLRRVVLVDHWPKKEGLETPQRILAEEHDWRSLESCIYGLPMDLMVFVLGASRDGRRHGSLTRAWLHPVNQDLRFQKRDGGEFGGNWERVFREDFNGSREEWLDGMTSDGVLSDAVLTHTVYPENAEKVKELAYKKLARMQSGEIPDPQPSRCFSPITPCQFRAACPYFRMPSEDLGFIKTTSLL